MTDPLFKDDRVRAEWSGTPLGHFTINPLMKLIAQDAVDFLATNYDDSSTITCILRTPQENDALYGGNGDHLTGVHVLGRGVDLRWPITSEIAVSLAEYLNRKYTYDPERKYLYVALVEGCDAGNGSSARHIHLQVHPNTVENT